MIGCEGSEVCHEEEVVEEFDSAALVVVLKGWKASIAVVRKVELQGVFSSTSLLCIMRWCVLADLSPTLPLSRGDAIHGVCFS